MDTTNKDVDVKSPLYKDRLMTGLANVGVPVQDLTHVAGDSFIIPERIPMSDKPQVYQVLVKSSGGNLNASNVHLFKQVQKDLRVNAGHANII